MHKRTTALAIASLFALTACGAAETSDEPAAAPATAGANRPVETETATPVPTETEEPVTEAPSDPAAAEDEGPDAPGATIFEFGQTKTWRFANSLDEVDENSDPAVSITVSEPETFDPGEETEYMMEQWPAHVRMQITLINQQDDQPFDPSFVTHSLQSSNEEGEEMYIYDSPSTQLLPGREATWQVAYGVQDPDDLVLQIAPDFEYAPAIFTNTQ